ncbi:MAG: hypothetical protein IBJ09_03810 [Bacteroidia bacterium]|nr:hypothetical protein [Bacteroidia bacterium]
MDPAVYMQMAIDVMKTSVAESRPDLKISPKVGAVLLKPDGTTETACRGELRLGDHAEYTLLERKKRSEALDGCILFATLEPCAPGARKHPKLGCAERIVNARIKEVWIGIEDPDPDVDRKGIKFLQDNGITVHMFYPEFQRQIEEANRDFLKQAIQRAEAVIRDEIVTLSPLEKPDYSAALSYFSREALDFYIKRSGLPFNIDFDELWDHFERIGLTEKVNNRYIPTGFGLLLFGHNAREKYPQAVIKAKVKYGNNPFSSQDFDGPLVLIPEQVETWLTKVLHSEVIRNKFRRSFDLTFPLEPLREAVINAIIHRDYELLGAKIFIEIDDTRIVIKSPGQPVSPVTLEEVTDFRAPSLNRNPKIAYIFNKMGWMEESGLGMETFRNMQDRFHLPMPVYSYQAPYLSLTFSRSINALKDIPGNEKLAGLNREELAGFDWVKSLGTVSKKDYATRFGFDDKKAYRHLSKFKKLGLVADNKEAPRSNNYRYVYPPK